MNWLLSLSVGAVRARFAENSCKVFPELCRFPACWRLRGEPGAEGGEYEYECEQCSLSMRLRMSQIYFLSIFSGLRGERGDFENDSMETPL